jgi:hypothetical protein
MSDALSITHLDKSSLELFNNSKLHDMMAIYKIFEVDFVASIKVEWQATLNGMLAL